MRIIMDRRLRLLVGAVFAAAVSVPSTKAHALPPSPPTVVPQVPVPAQAPAPAEDPAEPASPPPGSAALPPLPSSAPEVAPSEGPADPSAYNPADDADPSALTEFHDSLAPYGSWEDDGTYGTVWVPSSVNVGADFTPYVSNGHWALTEDDSWLWVSDFNWGWAPFHYGRWVWIGGRGWGWIPGRVYAPAWVVWRTGYYDDYYVGWAPMPPTWYWRGGFAVGLHSVPPAPFVFCSSRYVFYPRVHSYIVPATRVSIIAPRTRPYVAASASVGPSATYRTGTFTRGPTIGDAHIPAQSVPATRVVPGRILAYRPPTASGRFGSAQPVPRDGAPRAPTQTFSNGYTRPPAAAFTRPAPPAAPSYTRPSAPTYAPPAAPNSYQRRPAPVEAPRPSAPMPRPSYPVAPIAPVQRPPQFSPPRQVSPAPPVYRSPATTVHPSFHRPSFRR